MTFDPLANLPGKPPRIATTRRTIISIPVGCHLMVPASAAGLLQEARFVRIGEDGNVRPLAMGNIQATTISVAETALDAVDQAYFQSPGASNEPAK